MAESQQEDDNDAMRDAAAFLNSYCTKNRHDPPSYTEKSSRGEPHKRTFCMTCSFMNLEVSCEGKSKKETRRACAVEMVRKMREEGLLSSSQSVEYEPVSVLQLLLQKKNYPLPRYDEAGESGQPHCKQFTIRATACYANGDEMCEPSVGVASSKKEAKKKAASDLLGKVKPLMENAPMVKQTTIHANSKSPTATSSNISSLSNSMNTSPATGSSPSAIHDRSMTQSSPLSSAPFSVGPGSILDSLNAGMASLSVGSTSCDTTDGIVNISDRDIDVVYVAGDDKELCLATVHVHQTGRDVTGCGHGDSKENARKDAVINLMSNLSVLYPSVQI